MLPFDRRSGISPEFRRFPIRLRSHRHFRPASVHVPPPNIEFYEAAHGRRLAVRLWDSPDAARARVVFLHGVTSHGGWYTRSCQHLAAAGCEVHFLDRRGSGLNRQQPGDVDHWQTWLDDVAVYLKQIRGPQPVVL